MRAAHISRKWQHYFAPVGGGGELPAYYVDGAAGNDTTGDGSKAAPWATITKALASVPDAACEILVAAGTYAENTTGTNYLYITRQFSERVTVRGVGAVTITDNSSGSYTVRVNGAVNLRFKNVTIQPVARQTVAIIFLLGTISGLEFEDCTIRANCTGGIGNAIRTDGTTISASFTRCTVAPVAGYDSDFWGVRVRIGSGETVNMAFTNCTMIGTGETLVDIQHEHATASSTITIAGGTYTNGADVPVWIIGGSVQISGATFTSTSQRALVLGVDGVGTYATSGTVSDCTISSESSHAFLIGGGCDGVVCSGLTVSGGDYAVVLKEVANCTIDDSDLTGGTVAPLYFKAANGCTVTGSTISGGSLYQVSVGNNPANANATSGTVTLTDNTITAADSSDIFSWGDATEDSGGSVCDRNTYDISATTGDLGSVYGTDNIANLAALQAAWSTYDVPTNDANSTVIE